MEKFLNFLRENVLVISFLVFIFALVLPPVIKNTGNSVDNIKDWFLFIVVSYFVVVILFMKNLNDDNVKGRIGFINLILALVNLIGCFPFFLLLSVRNPFIVKNLPAICEAIPVKISVLFIIISLFFALAGFVLRRECIYEYEPE